MTTPLLQLPEDGCAGWSVRAAGNVLTVSLVGWHSTLVPAYVATVRETPDAVTLDVEQSVQQETWGFWFTSGHDRQATAVLAAPLGTRELLDPHGRRLPVANATALLEPSPPWRLVSEAYQPAPQRAWESRYAHGPRHVTLKQSSPELTVVDWQRTFFTPRLLDRPDVRRCPAVLFTFAGEEDSNLVLAWQEPDRGVVLQALGGFDGSELVRLANTLGAQGTVPHRSPSRQAPTMAALERLQPAALPSPMRLAPRAR